MADELPTGHTPDGHYWDIKSTDSTDFFEAIPLASRLDRSWRLNAGNKRASKRLMTTGLAVLFAVAAAVLILLLVWPS